MALFLLIFIFKYMFFCFIFYQIDVMLAYENVSQLLSLIILIKDLRQLVYLLKGNVHIIHRSLKYVYVSSNILERVSRDPH